MEAGIAGAAEQAMTPPRGRWFAFNLRMSFAMVTVSSILLAWVGHSLDWIGDRERIVGTRVLEYRRDPSETSRQSRPHAASGCLVS
jgi:hypothetical protein